MVVVEAFDQNGAGAGRCDRATPDSDVRGNANHGAGNEVGDVVGHESVGATV